MGYTRGRNPKRRRLRHTRRRMRGGANYTIVNILDTTPELREEIEAHLQICWPDTRPVQKVFEGASRSNQPLRVDLMYKRGADDRLVFSRIIHHWVDEESLYIQETCISPEERNKGHYKQSLAAMRAHYPRDVFKKIRNKAEYETIGNIDHSTRLFVFHKMGYRLRTLLDDYGGNTPLEASLKSGGIVTILRPVESGNRDSFKYVVKTTAGEEKVIDIREIELCKSPIYKTKTVFVRKEGGSEVRDVVRSLGDEGFVTRNPETGEEVVPWLDILHITYDKEIDLSNPDNHETIYCPLEMDFDDKIGYEIVKILDTSPELRAEVQAHIQVCWPEDTTSIPNAFENTAIAHNADILYKRGLDGRIVFSRLIIRWPGQKTLYIAKTCVSPEERNKGHYKNSLLFMRAYYSSKHPGMFDKIQNDVEYDTIGGVDFSTRLNVFHKLGYRFNPIVETNGDEEEPLHFKLKSGEVVYILEPLESGNDSFKYRVKTSDGGEKSIDVNDIDSCQVPIYKPAYMLITKGRRTERREIVREAERGYITINPTTGAEEMISWGDGESKWKRAGNPFDPENLNKTFCQLQMKL